MIETPNIMPSAKYVEKNIDRLFRIKEETGVRPPHCVICMKVLTSKSSKTVWSENPLTTYAISSTKDEGLTHPQLVGPTCWKRLRKAERELSE